MRCLCAYMTPSISHDEQNNHNATNQPLKHKPTCFALFLCLLHRLLLQTTRAPTGTCHCIDKTKINPLCISTARPAAPLMLYTLLLTDKESGGASLKQRRKNRRKPRKFVHPVFIFLDILDTTTTSHGVERRSSLVRSGE